MWTISQLKENAKAALKNFYGAAIVVTIIVMLLGGGGGGGSAGGSSSGLSDIFDKDSSSGSGYSKDYDFGDGDFSDFGFDDSISSREASGIVGAIAAIVGGAVLLAVALGCAYSAFVAMPIQVGEKRFYLDARAGDAQISRVFSQFKAGKYMDTVKTMFVMTVKVMLWSLLFIIPGIIKSYEYMLVPYILAENPNIDRKRAFEISSQTMNGEKMNFFILQLSFIGWGILAAITCGIGSLFLTPYISATNAEFYSCMREKALASGIASPSELFGGFGGYYEGSVPADGFNTNGYMQSSDSYNTTSSSTGYTSNFGGSMDEISMPEKNEQPADSYGTNGTYTPIGSYTSPETPEAPKAPEPPLMPGMPDVNDGTDGLLRPDGFDSPDEGEDQ